MRRIAFGVLILSILFTACGPGKKVLKQQVVLDTVKVTPISYLGNVYHGATPLVWDITHTRVALSFNWKERTADGQAWIMLHPYSYAVDTLVLDAKSMRIDSVLLMQHNTVSSVHYTYQNDQLKIHFSKPYRSSDSIELYIRYRAMPYASPIGGSSAISEDRGLYFINTDNAIAGKPAQIWTQGESESNSHWLPTIDKPNTRFTIQIELTVPDTMQTLSNGELIKSTGATNGQRTDIWKINMPIQAYAAMFAIGKYTVIKDKWKGKDVNYYVEPAYAPYARKIFNNTPEMMDYFSSITGVPYPWNKYDQVIVRDYVSGAMENTTASLFGEFMNQNAREIDDRNYEDVVSHELFHQWFGDYVTCESWANLTLNESFANYSEQLWREYKYGAASADKLGYEYLQRYLGNPALTPLPLVRYYYNDREQMFDPVTYEKGGAILNYIRSLAGDSAFFKAMNIYLTKNALHSAEVSQWRMALEEATGQDWNWFFNQWYFRGGHPILDVDYDYDDNAGQLTVTIEQIQDDTFTYVLPLEVAVFYGNTKSIVSWNIHDQKATFTYPYHNGQKPVVVADYAHWLPGLIKDNKEPAEWLTQFIQCDDYINKRKAVVAAIENINDSSAQELLTLALKDKMSYIRELAAQLIGSQNSDRWKDKWSSQMQYMALQDGNHIVRGNAFGALGNWKITAAKQSMIDALSDSSYYVAGSALSALNKIDDSLAYIYAKKIYHTHPESSLQNVMWSVIGDNGDDSDIVLFEQQAPYIYGTKKLLFAAGLFTYLKNVSNDNSYNRALTLLTNLINTESIKGYRSGLGSYLFETSKYYKVQLKTTSEVDAPYVQKKLDAIKPFIRSVMEAEQDAENLRQYRAQYPDANIK